MSCIQSVVSKIRWMFEYEIETTKNKEKKDNKE